MKQQGLMRSHLTKFTEHLSGVFMGINRVILIGRLCNDPEVKSTKSGSSFAAFRLATNDTYKDKAGEKKQLTEYHSITCFDGLADTVCKYVKKGSQIYVEGKLTTRSWEDESGNKQYATSINAKTIEFLDSKKNDEVKSDNRFTGEDIPF